ncbi:CRISPR-associated endonuclease Cas2, partial [Bifidobacterium adolescentis]|uniref:CRISPR-associated endonuclease Cas2 n=1 Tax=Bifidobacterium adolescentis TaxID=1680 RepID=UPI0022E080C9
MMVVVAYDVSTETPEGKRRLRLVAKTCMKYGQRVQNSVFECSVSPSDYLVLVHDLLKIANIDEDSLRITPEFLRTFGFRP